MYNLDDATFCMLGAGHRIGKGEGFSDLEYAVMKGTGAVDDNTIIVTTVHDEQVCVSDPTFPCLN